MNNDTSHPIRTAWSTDPELLRSNRNHRRIGSIIKEFGLNTSTHGIPGIARSETIIAYFQYPTQTSVSIIVEWPQAFPAVTVCNYSPLRYDRFIDPFLNYTNTLNLTNTTNKTNFTMEHSFYIRDFLLYKLNQNESLNDFFHSLDSMMMSCIYNNMPCTTANFTWFISSLYGLCYTFNALLKTTGQDGLKYNADNGANGLLELRFYVHQHQYVPYLSNGIGLVVLVHDNKQISEIELNTMQLGPERHHRLRYAKKTSLFLSSPYTPCNDKLNLGMQAMFNEYHDTDYGYTQLPCFTACIQAYTYEKFGCGQPFRWTTRSIVIPNTNQRINIQLCDLKNSCYIDAASEIMNTRSIWTTYCPDCTQECTYSEFIIKSTSLLALSKFLMNDIKTSSITWASEIQWSFVSLKVAYETSRTEIYSQQATMSPVDVISNIGGQTGLWIGIGFLSLMEVAEMIYRILRSQYHRFWRVRSQNIHPEEPHS
ncbi:hypothetical protein I4U23_004313 [Adineta vaga]|nr:hypothetical protein I4U23_004313 [Adineta vaga]